MRKYLALVLTLALLCISMCSCAPNDPTKPAESNPASSTETLSGVSSEASSEPFTMSIFQFMPEYSVELQQMADAYMDENSNVTIELEIVGDGYLDLLKSKASIGEMPDIFMTEGHSMTTPFLEFAEDLSDQKFTDALFDSAKEGVTFNGKVVGLPVMYNAIGIDYNKDIFTKYALEVPENLSELKAVCETLKANGVTPFVNQYMDAWMLGEIVCMGFSNVDNSMEFVEKVNKGEAKLAETKEMDEIMDFIQYTLDNGQEDPLACGWDDAAVALAQGDGAMLVEGIGIFSTIKAVNPDVNLGMFAVPIDDEPSKMSLDVFGMWMVSKDSEHKEEAKAFLNWIVESEGGKQFIKSCIGIPAWDVPAFEDNTLAKDALRYRDEGRTCITGYSAAPAGYESRSGEIGQAYILGDTDKAQTLINLDEEWARLYENAN